MKNIIIPTDFSEKSKEIIDYGIYLANQLDKQIEIIYVIDQTIAKPFALEHEAIPTSVPDLKELAERAKTKLQELLKEIDRQFKKRPIIRVSIKSGLFSDVLVDLSQDETSFAILLPGQDEAGIYKSFLTGPKGKILKEADCPVWIIPPDIQFTKPQTIIYVTDYKETDIESLKKLSLLAKQFDSRIIALHISENEDFTEEIKDLGFEDLAKRETGYEKIEIHSTTGKNDIETINQFAKKENADLIVMLEENRGFLEEIFYSSTTRKLVLETRFPVMIFHEDEHLISDDL